MFALDGWLPQLEFCFLYVEDAQAGAYTGEQHSMQPLPKMPVHPCLSETIQRYVEINAKPGNIIVKYP